MDGITGLQEPVQRNLFDKMCGETERIIISTGDFLKNAGIVGLKYLLKTADAEENEDYGITGDGQGLWLKRE